MIIFTDKILISWLWNECKANGLIPKNIITWVKPNTSPAPLVRRNLISSTEFILWAVKPGAEHTFNDSAFWDKRNYITMPMCGGNERALDEKKNTLHPTQKPENLIRPLVEVFSNRGDLVLDGFAGTGTTGAIAKQLNRKFIGVEQNQQFFEYMKRRLA